MLGALVEEAVRKSVLSLTDRRVDLAEEVLAGDKEIDAREVQLEEECLKVLALHQPLAHDLRFVVSAMKVNNDLERVGDLAGNLAERVIFLCGREPLKLPEELMRMSILVPPMLRSSLDALLQFDTEKARSILVDDETVDELHAKIFEVLAHEMREHPADIEALMQLLSVSRYFERIADLATNIAEDVLFLVDAEVVRHRAW